MALPPPPALPPILPYLPFTHPLHSDQVSCHRQLSSTAFSTFHNQNHRTRGGNDAKVLCDLDKEELALQAKNVKIAIHGQLYLRPVGLQPYTPAEYYAEQDQATPSHVDETFNQEEVGQLAPLTEEEDVEEYYEEEELEEEEVLEEEEEQDLDADIEPPSEASYLTMSPNTNPATPLHTQADQLFDEVASPITPSNFPQGQMNIEALSDLVHAISRGWRGFIDSTMDMDEVEAEEAEDADLDAEIEDMDDNPDSEGDIDDDI